MAAERAEANKAQIENDRGRHQTGANNFLIRNEDNMEGGEG